MFRILLTCRFGNSKTLQPITRDVVKQTQSLWFPSPRSLMRLRAVLADDLGKLVVPAASTAFVNGMSSTT